MKTVIIKKNYKCNKKDTIQKIIQFQSKYTWKRIFATILMMNNRNTMRNMMMNKIPSKMKKLFSHIDRIYMLMKSDHTHQFKIVFPSSQSSKMILTYTFQNNLTILKRKK